MLCDHQFSRGDWEEVRFRSISLMRYRSIIERFCWIHARRGTSPKIFWGTIYLTLQRPSMISLVSLIAGTAPIDVDDLLVQVKASCSAFKQCKSSLVIPGSTELYLFPSLLYSTLAQYAQLQGNIGREASGRSYKRNRYDYRRCS